MANRCTPRAVAKIIPTTLKGLLAHEVFYLGKSEGVFLSEKNAERWQTPMRSGAVLVTSTQSWWSKMCHKSPLLRLWCRYVNTTNLAATIIFTLTVLLGIFVKW